MVKRIASTLVLWTVIVLTIIYFRRDGVVILLALFAAATQHELYVMLEKIGRRPFRRLGIFLGALLILVPYFTREYFTSHGLGPGEKEGMESALIAITIVACCARVMRERAGSNRMETLISTIFGIVYVPFMLFFVVRIMWLGPNETSGMMMAVWLLVAAKFCDVGALLVGSMIGRHKLAPSMSPGKTWEGAIGGVLIASALCGGLVAVFPDKFPPQLTPWLSALIALPPAIISITSDLIESVLKRMAEVKDSGKTIPGIGGAFDLTDSLILAAPVAYLLLRVVV